MRDKMFVRRFQSAQYIKLYSALCTLNSKAIVYESILYSPSIDRKNAARRRHEAKDYLLSFWALFSHFWLAMPQLVLQADWQEVWHSPQPPFLADSHRLRVFKV